MQVVLRGQKCPEGIKAALETSMPLLDGCCLLILTLTLWEPLDISNVRSGLRFQQAVASTGSSRSWYVPEAEAKDRAQPQYEYVISAANSCLILAAQNTLRGIEFIHGAGAQRALMLLLVLHFQ